jgi:hypothetical protein
MAHALFVTVVIELALQKGFQEQGLLSAHVAWSVLFICDACI